MLFDFQSSLGRASYPRTIDRLRTWANSSLILPKSPLGKAIIYTLGQWTALQRYLEEGVYRIDNNLVENAIRPTCIGKKNRLSIGHSDAGWRSAVTYSVLMTARRYGLDPVGRPSTPAFDRGISYFRQRRNYGVGRTLMDVPQSIPATTPLPQSTSAVLHHPFFIHTFPLELLT